MAKKTLSGGGGGSHGQAISLAAQILADHVEPPIPAGVETVTAVQLAAQSGGTLTKQTAQRLLCKLFEAGKVRRRYVSDGQHHPVFVYWKA